MKDFLKRILEDSYNFNKLERVLELKLIDIQEKCENHQKVENLLNYRNELSDIRNLLLDENLCRVYKSCKIISFLLTYYFLYNRSTNTPPSKANLASDSLSNDNLNSQDKSPKEHREHTAKDDRDDHNKEEWHKFVEELTNASLDSATANIENDLINLHLATLLHDLTLYLTHQLFNRRYKTLVSNVYNSVVKLVNSIDQPSQSFSGRSLKTATVLSKLNAILLTILNYYQSTNQLQIDHITRLDRLCNHPNSFISTTNGSSKTPTSLVKCSTCVTLDGSHKALHNCEITYTVKNPLLKTAYDLMLKVNKNYLSNHVDKLESVDTGFLIYMLIQVGSHTATNNTSDNLNLYNIYQFIIKLITDVTKSVSTIEERVNHVGFDSPQKAHNTLKKANIDSVLATKTVQIFDLLKVVINLLNKDLILVHLNKVAEIVNLIFKNRFLLVNYAEFVLELVKFINGRCVNFNSLINHNLLAELVASALDALNNTQSNEKPTDIPVDMFKLHLYLIDHKGLESLVHTYMNDSRLNLFLFDHYVSNVIANNTESDRSLLLQVYSVVKGYGNSSLMGQLQFLLSH